METKLCKGPRHREGKQLPIDSFASARSKWCRGCMSDYDKQRGSSRGEPRSIKREKKTNIINMTNGELGLTGKGVERVAIPEIDKLVDKYVKARDVRIGHTAQEVEAKTKLIDALHGHSDKLAKDKDGTIIYRHDDLIVTLKQGKEELKVKTEETADEE